MFESAIVQVGLLDVSASEWAFVGAAFSLTWIVLAGYTLYLKRRLSAARDVLASEIETGEMI